MDPLSTLGLFALYIKQHHLQPIRMGHKSSENKRQLWNQSSHKQWDFFCLAKAWTFLLQSGTDTEYTPMDIFFHIVVPPSTFHLSDVATWRWIGHTHQWVTG